MGKRRGHSSGDRRDAEEAPRWVRAGFEGAQAEACTERKVFLPKRVKTENMNREFEML